MLDPENIPYDAIERDQKAGYYPSRSHSSNDSITISKETLFLIIGVIAGIILGYIMN